MTRERPPITARVRWMYGIGSAAYGVKDNGFSYFLLFYYNQVLGLPGAYAGLAILIAMVTQVIGDNIARAFSLVGALSIVRFRQGKWQRIVVDVGQRMTDSPRPEVT